MTGTLVESMAPVAFQRVTWRSGARIVSASEDGTALCVLVESGLVAEYAAIDGTKLACFGLKGPGTLIVHETKPGWPEPVYLALTTVTSTELPSSELTRAMCQSPSFHEAYLAQMRDELTCIRQVAACNAHHTLAERCAHWLLNLHAHLGNILPLTHAGLATLLGVRRAGVTLTLKELQQRNAIRQQRGTIVVVDPPLLRTCACSCPINQPTQMNFQSLLADAGASTGMADGPRRLFEREVAARTGNSSMDESEWVRREVALQICRSVMTHGQALLAN
jgi:CRP-like cAMP-binding protein